MHFVACGGRVLPAWVIAIAVIGASACGEESNGFSLSVTARTSLVPGPEFSLVETDLLQDVADVSSAEAVRHFERSVSFGDTFRDGVHVAEMQHIAAGSHAVRVRLRRPDGRVLIERRVRIAVANDTVTVVDLTRDCVGVSCPGAGSAALSECLGAQCVTPDCTPEHRELCPSVVFCNADSECGEVSACATKHCIDGLCEPGVLEGACAADEWCDPSPMAGCTPFVPVVAVDASVQDAGTPDMFVPIDMPAQDAGMASSVCGLVCTLTDDLCHFGVWNCATGTPVCEALPPRPTGTSCGVDHVCNLAGECVLCEHDGERCSIGCQNGTISCRRGYSVCELDSPGVDDAVGTPCINAVCVDSQPCTTDGSVCTSNGFCVPCSDGASCLPDACTDGVIVCAHGGTCEMTSHFATGTQCSHGPDAFCTSAHVCQECTSHACTRSNPCENGYVNCAVDPEVCAPAGFRPAGSDCGTGRTCDAMGNCIDCIPGVACGDACAPGVTSCTTGTSVCVPTGSVIPPGGACGPGRVCSASSVCEDCTEGASCGTDVCSVGGILTCGSGRVCAFASGGGAVGDSCAPSSVCDGQGRCRVPLDAVDISAGYDSTCVLLADGQVVCYGSLAFTHPIVPNLYKIAAGVAAVCGLDAAGAVWCWGQNNYGQLGDGTTDARDGAWEVPLAAPAVDLSAGNAAGECAVLSTGEVMCWGGDFFGGMNLMPVEINLLSNATRVVTGSTHACAIVSPSASVHEVWCWGNGPNGELGDGMYAPAIDPVQAVGITDAIDLVVGEQFTCVVHATGSVSCFGSGADQDAMGVPQGATGVPNPVATTITDARSVGSGEYHVCVIEASGDVSCFGMFPGVSDWHDFGMLGNVSSGLLGNAVPATGLHNVVQVVGGGLHSCARDSIGAPYCWGFNTSGELGVNPATIPTGFTPLGIGGPF